MKAEDVAAEIASLKKGAENTDKFLDRLERGLDLVDRELKELKDSRLGVEKQYESMFSELQHKLNEVQELRDKLKSLTIKTKEKESRTNEAIGKLRNSLSSFESNCESHKKKTREKTAWYVIKNETGLALRIIGSAFGLIAIGAIVGKDKLILWLLG
ncbi:hypothetical protein KAR91_32935 [Candidatus Pacearchaeota archaeon]|nr:hypothetical protein [Candidatus Pacearchaeota archaeon]